MHEPFIISLRTAITEVMTKMRYDNYSQGERHDFWLKEFEDRASGKGEFEPQITLVAEGKAESANRLKGEEESQRNFQKKVLPWQDLETEKKVIKSAIEHRQRNQIIVCASLIDKVPNLAGLTRTCEIMNAQALVISNSAVTKSEEFKSIAVTAEKWLPIYEVREENLAKYLEFQKQNGYTILGLEQTADSQMIDDYRFPAKCILLLGKEKEGIPQEYYGVVDQCIEIPQFGIIRSLNVHVSGAICLWEYTKQANK
mmetsp:Transcript_15937/g.26856  ORF Transcript_15937/g.26856 Transcript_15937/m.26856 type:complete len:256 (-) Transcript_15937:15-782(-)